MQATAAVMSNARLREIHDRHAIIQTGIHGALAPDEDDTSDSHDDPRQPLQTNCNNERNHQLQQQQQHLVVAMKRSMPVFAAELKYDGSFTRRTALDESNEENLRRLGRDKPRSCPAAPKPASCRRSLPDGEPIQARQEILEQADEFDREHKRRTASAHASLVELAMKHTGRGEEESTRRYFRELEELRRHRFEHTPSDEAAGRAEAAEAAAAARAKRANAVVGSRPRPSRQSSRSAADLDLSGSVWKARPKWADSKAFLDTEAVYEKGFCLDWSRALRSHRLAAFILKNDDGDGDASGEEDDAEGGSGGGDSAATLTKDAGVGGDPNDEAAAESELVDVGDTLWRHHALIYRTFDAYAAADTKVDVSSITYNAFKDFVQDCDLDESGDRFCDSADFDRLFIQVNSKAVAGGRSSTKDVVLTEKLAGRYGVAVREAVHDKDTRSLCRHEWLNCLVRIAVMKYVKTAEMSDVSRAIERLLAVDIGPRLPAWVMTDRQIFRRQTCYTEAVTAVLFEHRVSLQNLFAHYADTEQGRGAARERTLMSLGEWHELLIDCEILDDRLSRRDATIAFVLSRHHVVDENGKDAHLKLENLSLEDFYEALCRIACMKALPSDREIDEAGCFDAGDFLLRLRDEKAEDEWLNMYYAKSPEEVGKRDGDSAANGVADVDRPRQPAHRCLTHLILLILRTVERHGGESHDLHLTRRELRAHAQRGDQHRMLG